MREARGKVLCVVFDSFNSPFREGVCHPRAVPFAWLLTLKKPAQIALKGNPQLQSRASITSSPDITIQRLVDLSIQTAILV